MSYFDVLWFLALGVQVEIYLQYFNTYVHNYNNRSKWNFVDIMGLQIELQISLCYFKN